MQLSALDFGFRAEGEASSSIIEGRALKTYPKQRRKSF